MSLLVQWMFKRPKPLFLAREPKWRPWWRMMRQDIGGPVLFSVKLYVGLVILGSFMSLPFRGDDGLEPLPAVTMMMLGGTFLVTFFRRLLHLITLSVRLG